jgi:hypothetical protein
MRTPVALAMTAAAAAVITIVAVITVGADTPSLAFHAQAGWPTLPQGREKIGNMHGDVAVSSAGEVYVSVQDPDAGLQVFGADGRFLRNVPNAPSDFHGFVINRERDGEFLYGVRLREQSVVKMKLDGTVVLMIPSSAFPEALKVRNARSGQLALALTDVILGPGGDLYVSDGYASDVIHRFDRAGKYLASFGGKKEPYGFSTLHKLALDTRFTPARLIACDRANNRVVHLSLDGEFLGVVAKDLLLPAAVVIYRDYAIVGELRGRVTVLDKSGAAVSRLGMNTDAGVGGNQIPPELWRLGIFGAPHGVAVNERGDLFVSEFNASGRVHRFNRQP